ncbi:ABC-F family ATP-binding cassette domain-containing protein, partial [Cereibacter changlensis]
LRLGHSDQALSQLDGFPTPWEAVKRSASLPDQQARSLLAGAGIGIDAQVAPLARLSGGQRARLAMLLLRLARPNFYLLDEPTNHLDIEGQDMLETELVEQGAACLLVSHDRAFVRAVATRIWVIEGRRLVEVEDPDPVFDRLMRG